MKKRARGPTRVREEGGGGGKWEKKWKNRRALIQEKKTAKKTVHSIQLNLWDPQINCKRT